MERKRTRCGSPSNTTLTRHLSAELNALEEGVGEVARGVSLHLKSPELERKLSVYGRTIQTVGEQRQRSHRENQQAGLIIPALNDRMQARRRPFRQTVTPWHVFAHDRPRPGLVTVNTSTREPRQVVCIFGLYYPDPHHPSSHHAVLTNPDSCSFMLTRRTAHLLPPFNRGNGADPVSTLPR